MSHRLVTADDVRRLAEGERLRVPAGCLVTPAARDLAALRGIRIEPRSAPEAPPAALRDGDAVDLPDGDWLLEVRGGRVRLRRIE